MHDRAKRPSRHPEHPAIARLPIRLAAASPAVSAVRPTWFTLAGPLPTLARHMW